jgi:hypothetical protein
VHLFASLPLGAQYAVEHILLHAVLSTYSKDVLHPDAANVYGEVAEYKYSDYGNSPVDVASDGMSSNVDSMLDSPHLRKTDNDTKES